MKQGDSDVDDDETMPMQMQSLTVVRAHKGIWTSLHETMLMLMLKQQSLSSVLQQTQSLILMLMLMLRLSQQSRSSVLQQQRTE